MAQLLLTDLGGRTTLRIVVTPAMTIGRAITNHMVLDSPEASRKHAVVEADGPFCKVRDLSSLNGTFVNGQRVQAQVLAHGDVIVIGGCRLVFTSTEQERVSEDAIREISERGLLY